MNILDKIDNILSKISVNFVRVLFIVITIGMLIGNSVYLYEDRPSFRMNNILNYVGIFISAIIIAIVIALDLFLKKRFKSKYINSILLAVYLVSEIVFLLLVPIQVFSDMLNVVTVAISNFAEGMDYLQRLSNNLPIVIVFNLIFRLTIYDIWALKIFNVICNVITVYFTYKIYKNIYGKDNRLVLFLGISSIALFLYVNMLYNDIISTMLITVCLYLITKNNINKAEKVLIPILLFLQFIIRPVGIILIIATIMYYIFKQKNVKMVFAIVLTFLVLSVAYNILENRMIPQSEEIKTYPIWSFIQIGLNEEKFGFQDGSFSSEWTALNIVERVKDLGPQRLMKLLAKKEYWLWTEGTYQAERYAFGIGMEEQFYYDTFLTKQLYDFEDSNLRKGLEYVMKGQYFLMIFLALIDLFIKDSSIDTKNKKDLLLYNIVGIFCFYVVWEIKSRYLLCLYPIFLLLGASGIEKINNQINLRKEKSHGKV